MWGYWAGDEAQDVGMQECGILEMQGYGVLDAGMWGYGTRDAGMELRMRAARV